MPPLPLPLHQGPSRPISFMDMDGDDINLETQLPQNCPVCMTPPSDLHALLSERGCGQDDTSTIDKVRPITISDGSSH